MLSDVELYELKDKMHIQPTLKCIYKDHLKNYTFKPEEAYIINLADEALIQIILGRITVYNEVLTTNNFPTNH